MFRMRRDDPKIPQVYRTDRMVIEGGNWFFYTREKTLEGPFEGEIEAYNQLRHYIKAVTSGLLPEEEPNVEAENSIRRLLQA